MLETNRIEYKRELTTELDIEKEVVAFLNYKEGGYIYIGIDKDGSTVGVSDVDDCMLRLKDRIKHNISPSAMGLFDIAEEQKDGCSIIKVTVASGIEKPYFKTKYGMTPRGSYMRVGTSAEPMPQEQINRLFAMRTRNSIGRIVSNRQDLSFEQLRIYYDERGKRLNDNFKRTLELLTDDGKYNYVAYLLADENGNSIKVAKYSSLDRCDLVENNEYGYCSLIKATKSVLSKLDIENKVAATITRWNVLKLHCGIRLLCARQLSMLLCITTIRLKYRPSLRYSQIGLRLHRQVVCLNRSVVRSSSTVYLFRVTRN